MNKGLEALEEIKTKLFRQEGNTIVGDFGLYHRLDIIETELKKLEDIKEGITWRKELYKKDLDTGIDPDGIPLTETNRLITLNLYNIMLAIESYYIDDKNVIILNNGERDNLLANLQNKQEPNNQLKDLFNKEN